jgi:beta-1,4-mannosyl-glycoprotein beta-1,4-N-acetylglucosaminyltransferase
MSSLATRGVRRIRKKFARTAANFLPAFWLPRPRGSIFDCLMLFREIDLLEIRLNELYDHVDVFVIMESCKSFTGRENQPVFPRHAERFKKFRDKIRYIFIEEVPDSAYEDNPMTPGTLTCEFWQRRQLIRGLADAREDDLIVYSDADEIPTAEALRRTGFLLFLGEPMVLLLQSWRLLYLDAVVPKPWRGSGATTRANLRNHFQDDINRLWGPRWTNADMALVRNGGWHISFLGQAELIRGKMRACGHPRMEKEFLDALKEKCFNGFKFEPQPGASLPRFVRSHSERWSPLMYSDAAYARLCADLIGKPFPGHISPP